MTVLDSSAVVDYLVGGDSFKMVEQILHDEAEISAPEVLVFEVLAVLRRESRRALGTARADRAASRLGELSLALFPSMPLCATVWGLRHHFAVADAMFVALAQILGEPLVTVDAHLARAAATHTSIEVRLLTSAGN